MIVYDSQGRPSCDVCAAQIAASMAAQQRACAGSLSGIFGPALGDQSAALHRLLLGQPRPRAKEIPYNRHFKGARHVT